MTHSKNRRHRRQDLDRNRHSLWNTRSFARVADNIYNSEIRRQERFDRILNPIGDDLKPWRFKPNELLRIEGPSRTIDNKRNPYRFEPGRVDSIPSRSEITKTVRDVV